ncbi:MAG TPA: RidA family protein, partial [Dongiaceae bacterium]|nr:RidA family protein [Dongiaceae bacterium]
MKIPFLNSSLRWPLAAGLLCLPMLAHPRPGTTLSDQAPAGKHVLSPLVDAGAYIYISGQGARRSDGSLPGSFEDQVRQALNNLQAVVKSAGLTLDHVVYMQVYLEDTSKYDLLNKEFAAFFGSSQPARAVLGVYRNPESPVQMNAVLVRSLEGKKSVHLPNSESQDAAPAGMLTSDRLFVSSMAGADPVTGKIPDDPAAQVDLALDRLAAVVKAAGLELGNMV